MRSIDDIDAGDVAIVGMAGRFPGARSVDQFWDNLQRGVESVRTFSDDELRAAGVPEQALSHPGYIRAKAVLDEPGAFDAAFFGMSAREAQLTNPQHRLFLECAVEALEDAGHDPERYEGTIGVYAGAGTNSYVAKCYAAGLVEALGPFRTAIANDKDYLTTFTSYKLNLTGPSVAIQTACSTSLVAVHVACQALLGGECQMALAGGVTIDVETGSGLFYQEGGILSPDGHCRPFDEHAQGTVGGSGVVVVLLKTARDAVRECDHIYALIKGSATNNDGRRKLGYTAPSVEGQVRAISDAHSVSGVGPETITYVEAHGTATPLGDPIEIEALSKAGFGGDGPPCAIGSVKSNIGHLDVAAGGAGLIKTALALEHGLLPPSLHFERANPRIPFAGTRLFVNARLSEWEPNGIRRAAVSSFGIGGTNAHAVLEEPPAVEPGGEGRACQLICLSAKTEAALEASSANLAAYLRRPDAAPLADVAYTLHVGRSQMERRLAVTGASREEAAGALERAIEGREAGDARARGSLVFMFPGQGSQYAGMARGLYESEPFFREEVDRCLALAVGVPDARLKDLLLAPAGRADDASRELIQTQYAQIAIFIVEYTLARQLMAWGLRPDAMIGHSVGEYAAACIAGCFTLEDAMAVVARRGRLMQAMPAGAMLAVDARESDASAMLSGTLSLAAVNGPTDCVISGALDQIADLRGRLERQGVRSHVLATSHAFHSAMMDPILDTFAQEVDRVSLHPPRIPFVSNVSGTWVTPEQVQDPRYWARHVRTTVRFFDGVQELGRQADRLYVEVGPGRVLSALAAKAIDGAPLVHTMRGRTESRSDVEALLNAVGRIWTAGHSPSWTQFYEGQQRQRTRLPTYPFEHQHYWAEPRAGAKRPAAAERPDDAPSAEAPSSELEDLMSTQLRLMSEQLELLTTSVSTRQSQVVR